MADSPTRSTDAGTSIESTRRLARPLAGNLRTESTCVAAPRSVVCLSTSPLKTLGEKT